MWPAPGRPARGYRQPFSPGPAGRTAAAYPESLWPSLLRAIDVKTIADNVPLHLRRTEPPDAHARPDFLADVARRDVQGRQRGAEKPPPARGAVASSQPTIAMRGPFSNSEPPRRSGFGAC